MNISVRSFLVFVLPLLFFGIINEASWAYAALSDNVDVTIKLNICGDEVAEGPEQCDNSDLRGGSCRGLGYNAGNLLCDMACEYDTSSCYGVAPSPIPSSAPKSDGQGNQSSSSAGSSASSTSQTDLSQPSLVTRVIIPVIRREREVNRNLLLFDVNGDGLIDGGEIPKVVGKWVEFSRSEAEMCDLNGDRKCNLIDFSILMYYVDRS